MIPFTKMQGIGNDFVMVDAIRDPLPATDLSELAKRMNDRKFGIGGDGLILLEKSDAAEFRMRMFNPDGSESEMCGNGIRCFALLLRDHGHSVESKIAVETGAGVLSVEVLEGNKVKVDMGLARLKRGEIGMTGDPQEKFIEAPVDEMLHGTAVSTGNPHLVIFVTDASKVELEVVGPRLENHPLFPKRTNVHFVQVVDRKTLIQRTWERGAGATLACGTGACACAVAAAITDRSEREVMIHLPGGDREVAYNEDGRVFMTGPAETVFTGFWSQEA
jgi:diaminopimelate epimerase